MKSGFCCHLILGITFLMAMPLGHAEKDVLSEFDMARAEVSLKEKNQREILGSLFEINARIKSIAKKRSLLNQQLLETDAQARESAQEVNQLQAQVAEQREMLNSHLLQLYQGRSRSALQWLFSAKSPNELERHYRFLKKFLNIDHALLTKYISSLKAVTEKRAQLTAKVKELSRVQKSIATQEGELSQEQGKKSQVLKTLRADKSQSLANLQNLRSKHSDLSDIIAFAFFEKKGNLVAPAEGPLAREYGTYVDSEFHFRLAHKGLFYSLDPESPIHAVAEGKVEFSDKVPGYGHLVIIDHGDNYYTVYGYNRSNKVRRGDRVKAQEIIALSGSSSPLFGPGLYFELRHFSDAIDPKPWFKDALIKTASHQLSSESKESQ